MRDSIDRIDRIESAIRHIQTATDVDPWAAEIAVEAMRKQIPQRPVIGYAFPGKLREVMKRTDSEKAETKTDCCPVCGRTLGVSKFVQTQSGLRFGDPHCKRCGQAIDWDEVRDDEHIADVSKKVSISKVIRCKDCKFAHITNDGRYCKYCDMFTDDYGQLIEMYFDSNFYCGYAERGTDERFD